MDILEIIKNLCTPAYLYLVISLLSIFTIFTCNYNKRNYCLGEMKSHHPNSPYFYIYKIIYVLLVTFILNQLCERGYENISWFLILFPYILMFLLIIIAMTLIKPSDLIKLDHVQ
jgi:hypothetical protein